MNSKKSFAHRFLFRYWVVNKVEARVKYHTTLDFNKVPADILIFDESDDFLFKDSAAFATAVGDCRCICFTATPGGVGNTLETDIVNYLRFTTL